MTNRSRMVSRAVAALCLAALLALLVHWVTERSRAPAVDFTTLDGQRISLDQLRGKVVYVNFWATSCATCMKEMPEVIATYERFAPRNFELLAVAMSYDPPPFVRNFARDGALPFKVVLDAQGAIARAFDDVRLTPTAVIIDKQGRIVKRILGEPDFVGLRALIDKEMGA